MRIRMLVVLFIGIAILAAATFVLRSHAKAGKVAQSLKVQHIRPLSQRELEQAWGGGGTPNYPCVANSSGPCLANIPDDLCNDAGLPSCKGPSITVTLAPANYTFCYNGSTNSSSTCNPGTPGPCATWLKRKCIYTVVQIGDDVEPACVPSPTDPGTPGSSGTKPSATGTPC